jgi:tRNA modification GTPase
VTDVDGGAETIFALSSGAPPAALAVVRISGPRAGAALTELAGVMPPPRRASLARLRDPGTGELLDRALTLWFPGPNSATGEDLAELHLHGGRSVVAAVSHVLAAMPGLRPAQPGEFTRRAFEHGRIDLAEAEGLSDLLAAETEAQRRNAMAVAEGGLSRIIEGWRGTLLGLSARIEALLDFSDEADVTGDEATIADEIHRLANDIAARLADPPAERLKEGVRVVFAGPPNAGKSTLFNSLVGRDAAITSPLAGTTRDLIEAPVAWGGIPFLMIDTAGLRDAADQIEQIGVERAEHAVGRADIILWLGPPRQCPQPERAIMVHAQCDFFGPDDGADVSTSVVTGEGLDLLRSLLAARARTLLPPPDRIAFNQRQRSALADCLSALKMAEATPDLILWGESLRLGRSALDRVTGRAGVEDMLDALFGTFCIGK